jgi:7-cyano-7-deazaguanine synthase
MKVVIYSGGMDSFTLLHKVIRELGPDDGVCALSFNYGQKHAQEIDFAQMVCRKRNIPLKIITLPRLRGSALTDTNFAIPEGHYADETMRQTVVPNRNMIMLAYAVAYAIETGAGEVYYGAHAGDHAIYPDCREEFVAAFNKAIELGNYNAPTVIAPYINMSKGDIVAEGLEHDLDYSLTWTCYRGEEFACGKCGSCTERLEAFQVNGAIDPITYWNDVDEDESDDEDEDDDYES